MKAHGDAGGKRTVITHHCYAAARKGAAGRLSTDDGRARVVEARRPSTVPSPAGRGEFRFVAVDANGAKWHWIDE